MGRAQIISGGPDGRYTIRVDVGEARRSQLVAAALQNVTQVTAALAEAQAQLDAADAETEAVRLQAEAAVQAYVDAVATHGPTSMQAGDALLAYNKLATQLAQARSREFPLRVNRDQLRVTLQMAQARLSRWQSLVLSDTRPAWCADLTETAAGTVGTIEINGESDLILIKPGAPPASGADGALLSRELMSPEQAYYNAGVLPGWQKYRPTYRRGTITAINRDTHRCTVVLADASSSAQRLGINQVGALSNVPITYMTCHSEAFDPGDQVVVQFEGQNQAAPRVIGFVQDPKECPGTWPPIHVDIAVVATEIVPQTLDNRIYSKMMYLCDRTDTTYESGPPGTTFGGEVASEFVEFSIRRSWAEIASGGRTEHSIVVMPPVAPEAAAGMVPESSFAGVAWSYIGATSGECPDVSPAYLYNIFASTVYTNPPGSRQTLVVRENTIMSRRLTLPYFDGGSGFADRCYASGTVNGVFIDSQSDVAIVAAVPIQSALQDWGALPVITMVRGSRTKAYAFASSGASVPAPGAMFRLTFMPVEDD